MIFESVMNKNIDNYYPLIFKIILKTINYPRLLRICI